MRRAAILCLLLLAIPATMVDAQSGAGPVLTTIETMDVWTDGSQVPDGRIDSIRLVFDRAIAEETFRISDFDVAGRTILGYDLISENEIHLRIEELAFDTDGEPAVTLRSGHGLTGLTGLPATQSGSTVDKVGPVLISARAVAGTPDVDLVFSEPVTLSAVDLDYQDLAAGGATSVASLVSGPAGSWVATLDADVAAADIDVDRIAPKANVADAKGNGVATASQALAPVRVVEARGDIGTDLVVVRFNAPVRGASDQTFDVVYDDPPADPIAGVASASQPHPFEMHITLTDIIRPSDVRSSAPARLQVLGNDIAHDPSGDLVPFASLPILDKTPPRLLSVSSQDTDRNGYIDAVRLVWDEPVESVCWDGVDEEGVQIEDHRLDLAAGQLPSVDGVNVTVPFQEASTLDPDTGKLVVFTALACGTGDFPFRDLAEPPNDALGIRMGAIDELDGAAPTVIEGITRDQDGDGALDAYELTFSEAMATDAIDLGTWSVQGHNITGASWDDQDTLILGFEEVDLAVADGDTGDLPGVSHTGDAVYDLAGIAMRAFEGGGFLKIDGAFPVVVQAFGDEGGKVLRLVFSEGVEAPTDAENDPAGPGRGIRESDLAYQNAGGGNTGIVRVEHGKGDRVAKLMTAERLEAVDFGSGGDRVLPLQGHVRESNTKPAGERQTVSSQFISFIEKDVDAPGAVPESEWTVTSHNATYTFPAPPDDAGDNDSGAPTSYLVHVAETPFEVADVAAFKALEKVKQLTFEPAFAQPDAEQAVTIEGLCPGRTYHAALAAVDEDGNIGAPHIAAPFTLLGDNTPPAGTLQFLSTSYLLNETGAPVSTHLVGDEVAWTGTQDPESCEPHFFWALDEDPAYEVTKFDLRTDDPGVNITLGPNQPRPIHLYLHVAPANDDDLLGEQATYPLHIVQPAECSQDNILAPDLEVVHEGGFTRITWDDVELDLPAGFVLEGYQVWYQRATGKDWQLREEMPLPLEELKFIDDLSIDSAARYVVTAYFTDGLCRFAADEDGDIVEDAEGASALDGFSGPPVHIIDPSPSVPTWAWVVLVSISLLVVGGVALFYGMRRTKLDEGWLEDDEPEEDHDNPFGADPIADLGSGEGAVEDDPFAPAAPMGGDAPRMDIACPACTHQFSVQGHRPLSIMCPNCHASGVLE